MKTEGPVGVSGYLISGVLGEGGSSRVYRARPEGGGREVALKVAIRPELVAALRSEGAVLGRLKHPRFVEILEERLDGDPPCFVLELCPRGDLRQLLESQGGRLGPEVVEPLARALLEGVAFAHEEGFVHGDLKPENVLFDEAGEPRIADLGLARPHDPERLENTAETRPGGIRGTIEYVAPEVRAGADPSPASDVYALGVLLYELLLGRKPAGAFKLPREALGPMVPVALDRVVARALARDPRERYPDGGTMLADLEAGEKALGFVAPRRIESRAPRLSRRPRGTWLVGVVGLLAPVVGAACGFAAIHFAGSVAKTVVFGLAALVATLAWSWSVRAWALGGLRT